MWEDILNLMTCQGCLDELDEHEVLDYPMVLHDLNKDDSFYRIENHHTGPQNLNGHTHPTSEKSTPMGLSNHLAVPSNPQRDSFSRASEFKPGAVYHAGQYRGTHESGDYHWRLSHGSELNFSQSIIPQEPESGRATEPQWTNDIGFMKTSTGNFSKSNRKPVMNG
jgi:hypothetical protein